jgi:hypothetical protein
MFNLTKKNGLSFATYRHNCWYFPSVFVPSLSAGTRTCWYQTEKVKNRNRSPNPGLESVELGVVVVTSGVVVWVRGWAGTDVGVGWKCVSLAGELTTTLFLERLHHVSSLQCQNSVISWGCEQYGETGFVTSLYSFLQHLCSPLEQGCSLIF